ncbi:hypothetical protein BB2000_1024 [Proteus mirabilis BB2000]|nr:hypothetical protein BB2000_1024 [Proteus mirabilis BB2000]
MLLTLKAPIDRLRNLLPQLNDKQTYSSVLFLVNKRY